MSKYPACANALSLAAASTRRAGVWVALGTAAITAYPGSIARAEESHPGFAAEAEFAEAAVLYANKNYPEALKTLNAVLKASPNHLPALELKALVVKLLGNDAEAIPNYQKLIAVKPPEGRGPYYFELGMIHFKRKKFSDAKPQFEGALKSGYNPGACRFFLGSMAFADGKTADAAKHFRAIVDGDNGDLKVAALYYLGMINFQTGFAAGGTDNLMAARSLASKYPNSKLATDISKAAATALAPYDSSQWYASFTFATAYDGNVSLLPTTVTAPESTSGKTTFKSTLSGALGHMGSPLGFPQWVVNYRFSLNRNFNKNTRELEYFNHMPSVYLNFSPLAQTSFGAKIDGTFGFQNQANTDSPGTYTFRPYNLSGDVGPYLKFSVMDRLQLTTEVSYRPQKYFDDADGINAQGGYGLMGRVSARRTSESRWINVDGSVSYELNQARGTENQSRTLAGDLSNTMKLTDAQAVVLGASYSLSTYPNRSVARSDKTLGLRMSWVVELTRKWSISSDASYSVNKSNLPDTYSYSKPAVSAGISYSL